MLEKPSPACLVAMPCLEGTPRAGRGDALIFSREHVKRRFCGLIMSAKRSAELIESSSKVNAFNAPTVA